MKVLILKKVNHYYLQHLMNLRMRLNWFVVHAKNLTLMIFYRVNKPRWFLLKWQELALTEITELTEEAIGLGENVGVYRKTQN